MYDIDEDGSIKPYTAHYTIPWACGMVLFEIFVCVACTVGYLLAKGAVVLQRVKKDG